MREALPHGEVHIWERALEQGTLVERLLRAAVLEDALHAAVCFVRKPYLAFHVGGAWQAPRALPGHEARELYAQIDELFERAETSCDRAMSYTVRVMLPGVGTCGFRLHKLLPFVLSPVADAAPLIVDRHHERSRRERFEEGLRALQEGRAELACSAVAQALAMADALGRATEQIQMTLALGACLERAGKPLDAEREYKRALHRIEDAYGRRDLQRTAVFERLAACAASRGDRAVSDMWRLRAQHGAMLLGALRG